MSNKTVIYESKDMRLRYDVAVALRQIADGLVDGTLHIKDEHGSACIAIAEQLKFEVEIEEKQKSGGTKHSVEIEIEWYENAPDSSEEG